MILDFRKRSPFGEPLAVDTQSRTGHAKTWVRRAAWPHPTFKPCTWLPSVSGSLGHQEAVLPISNSGHPSLAQSAYWTAWWLHLVPKHLVWPSECFFLKNAILDTNILNKEIIDENTDFWLLFKSCSWGSTMHMMQPGSRHATALLDNSSAFHFEVCVFPHRSPHRTGANEGQRDFLLPEALPSIPGGNILWVPACSAPCMFLKSPLFMPTPRWGSSHKWWWKRH